MLGGCFMKDLISLLKKISPEWIIHNFSILSIEMFKNKKCYIDIPFKIKSYGGFRTLYIKLSAWDIQDIVYLSICNSNDYRHTDKFFELGQIVDLYRDYENEHSIAEEIKDADLDGVCRLLMGMTAEQFKFQNFSWIGDSFNRNYHILLGASNFEHREKLNIDDIVQSIFGFSANDFISVLLIVFWLCMQHPNPLTVPEEIYRKKEKTILTKKNVSKFIEYYTCNYQEVRTSPLGKQLLYSKPFIKTDKQQAYLSSNFYLVAMLMANGLYWIARDFYRIQGKQNFTNAFGLLYEDYLKELASIYCRPDQWKTIPQGKKKGADFFFDLGCASVIIESKSTLMSLKGKQQVPNRSVIDNFMKNTIAKAYEQLQSSYTQMMNERVTHKPLIKIILLYDDFSNTRILQQSISKIFDNDKQCFIMTIREFEILLYLNHYENAKCQKIIKCLLDQGNITFSKRKNVSSVYDEFEVWNISHFKKDLDYFSQCRLSFESEFK